MKLINLLSFLIFVTLISCSEEKKKKKESYHYEEPGVSYSEANQIDSLDSGPLRTRPSNVLETANSNFRLVTVYKINKHKKTGEDYIGNNSYYGGYFYDVNDNYTYRNFMPGLRAVYGYNMFNVGRYDFKNDTTRNFFDQPVLVNTLYYPSTINDTINKKIVKRNYYMMSVYNEDTNQDSTINKQDLRRLYHFSIDSLKQTPLIPKNYSVLNSEYDVLKDLMYVYARLDQNGNGNREKEEPIHVFWIDLKNPQMGKRLY